MDGGAAAAEQARQTQQARQARQAEPSRAGDAPADSDTGRLERGAAERVLRRAVLLDSELAAAEQRVTVQALLDAADELGIDRADVRRAVVEEELGLLEERRRRTDVLVGPERFVAIRAIDGSPDDLLERLDGWLRRGRGLRRSRRAPGEGDRSGWSEYARRADPLATLQRAVRAARGDERLAHVRRVRVVVRALDDRRCLVGLVVDASRSRRQATAAGAAVCVTGSMASVVGLWVPFDPALGAVGVAASAAAGVGVMLGRRAYTGDVGDELEALLDAVQRGGRPTSVIAGVSERFGQSRS